MGNAQDFAIMVVRYLVIIAGVVAIGAGVFQIVKGFVSGGKGQVNWGMAVGCLLVGGALTVGGISWVAKIAAGGKNEIDNAGTTGGTYKDEGVNTGVILTINGIDYIADFAD